MTPSRIPTSALAPVAGLLAAALLAATVLQAALGPSLPTTAEAPAPARPAPAAAPALVAAEPGDTGVPDAQRALRGRPEPLALEAPTF